MRRTMTVMKPVGPSWGSRLILYGAIVLIAASGFAAYEKLDTSFAWLSGIVNVSKARGTSLFEDLFLMFQTTPRLRTLISQILFLIAMVVVAFVAMSLRKRTRACLVLLLLCGLSFWAGCVLDLYSFDIANWMKLLYASPLMVISVGCILQVVHSYHIANMKPQYQRPVPRRTRQRISPPPIRRSAPEPVRQYRASPGSTRMVPDAVQPPVQPQPIQPPVQQPIQPRPMQSAEQAPMQQLVRQQKKPVHLTLPGKRLEKPVPDRAASHIGEPPPAPAQQPRYQWKTIKTTDNKDVIGQKE